MIMMPSMLAASILNPICKGSNLTNDEIMTGMEYIFNSAKAFGLDEASTMTQLTNYRGKLDNWSKEFVWAGCGNVAPSTWWKAFYAHTDLGIIAERILTTPLTSAATERSFSTFGNLHTKKRNRLTTERAGKLTFIAHNYKLMNPQRCSEDEPAAKRLRIDDSEFD